MSELHYPTQKAGAGGLLHVPGRLELWSKTTLYPYTQTAGMGGGEGEVGRQFAKSWFAGVRCFNADVRCKTGTQVV